jgi:predicted Zn-dependent protease
MKFTPLEIEGNVNVSPSRPLAEFAWLVTELALVIVAAYLLLGLATDLVADRIPLEAEIGLGQRALSAYGVVSNPALDRRVHELVKTLPASSPLHHYRFAVSIVDSDTVNAAALPGGSIIVFSGLLRKVRSENELAMVLAHELGHYAHRDHLRGLGRGLGIAVATQLLLGPDNSAAAIVSNEALPLFARYSRAQEEAADSFAVDLLQLRFGHAGGSGDFFSRIATEPGADPDRSYILASHPRPEDRISRLKEWIDSHGYPVRETVPLAADLPSAGEK